MISIWDSETGKEIVALESHVGQYGCLAFSEDGSWLASSGPDDRSVCIWDANKGKNQHMFSGHDQPVCGVALSPDNARLVSVDCAGEVRLWDMAGGRHALTLPALANASAKATWYRATVAFSPDGRRIARTNPDSSISIWDAEERRE
jgi:WD40 repeat protein